MRPRAVCYPAGEKARPYAARRAAALAFSVLQRQSIANMVAHRNEDFSLSPSEQKPDDGIGLQWPGKRLRVDASRPDAHTLEEYRPTGGLAESEQADSAGWGGLLLYGDNFDGLSWLLANGYSGSVRLVYMDPPYNSNRTYRSRVRLRGKGQPTVGEQTVYEDVWQTGEYLQFVADRLLLLRELLHEDGTLWLHCDHRMQAHLLLLLEEIFGGGCHLNTVFWRSQTMRGAKVHARYFPRSAQAIHIFRRRKEGQPVWQAPTRETELTEAEATARYMRDGRGFFRTSDPGTYSFERLAALDAEGRLYAPYGGEVVVDRASRRVYASSGGNLGVKYYLDQRGRDRYIVTRAVDNLWDDLAGLGTVPGEDENYPTQKTERLLQRVLETATRPGDLVLDPFVGAGTTAAVAQRMGRAWIGCDSTWRAVRTAAGRIGRSAQPSEIEGSEYPAARGGGYRILQVGDAGTDPGRGSPETERDGARSRLSIAWGGGRLAVRIEQFQSSCVARLAAASNAALPQDWRAQVRAVLIDPDYDGRTFRPEVVDAPEGRKVLVAGSYLCGPTDCRGRHGSRAAGERSVAVLIVDVAGGEHLVLRTIGQPSCCDEREARGPVLGH